MKLYKLLFIISLGTSSGSLFCGENRENSVSGPAKRPFTIVDAITLLACAPATIIDVAHELGHAATSWALTGRKIDVHIGAYPNQLFFPAESNIAESNIVKNLLQKLIRSCKEHNKHYLVKIPGVMIHSLLPAAYAYAGSDQAPKNKAILILAAGPIAGIITSMLILKIKNTYTKLNSPLDFYLFMWGYLKLAMNILDLFPRAENIDGYRILKHLGISEETLQKCANFCKKYGI